jgi:hypothetical protein
MVGLSSFNKPNQAETTIHYPDDRLLKRGIWLYFFLLIFEGALRKWFLPSLATPLLVVRDPIAMWLLYESWRRKLLPSTIYLNGMIIIGLIGFYLAMFVGHGNLIVALYGARILLVHFPLMFVIGRVFDREDILKMAKVTLWISVPMAILISKQFYSPQSAWVNRGLAGDTQGAGFSANGDFLRPPGTFSFTIGVTLFFGFLAPFVLYFWFNLKKINIWLLLAASGAMLISIPFSISRTLLFEICLTLAFAVFAGMRKPENFRKVMAAMVVGIVALGVLSQTKFFTTATAAFTNRLTSANETEGGLVKGVIGDRFFGGLLGALTGSSQQPFWGYGIGMGTNVGSKILTGNVSFLIAELEWGRIIGELGPFFGILVIILRVGLTIKIALACFRKLIIGDLLPWLLLSFGFIVLAQGVWAQPTALGFFVMIGGLLIASLKGEPVEDYELTNEQDDLKIIANPIN